MNFHSDRFCIKCNTVSLKTEPICDKTEIGNFNKKQPEKTRLFVVMTRVSRYNHTGFVFQIEKDLLFCEKYEEVFVMKKCRYLFLAMSSLLMILYFSADAAFAETTYTWRRTYSLTSGTQEDGCQIMHNTINSSHADGETNYADVYCALEIPPESFPADQELSLRFKLYGTVTRNDRGRGIYENCDIIVAEPGLDRDATLNAGSSMWPDDYNALSWGNYTTGGFGSRETIVSKTIYHSGYEEGDMISIYLRTSFGQCEWRYRLEKSGDSDDGSGIYDHISADTVLPKLTGLKPYTVSKDAIVITWTPNTEYPKFQAAISDDPYKTPEFPTNVTWSLTTDHADPQYTFNNLKANTAYYLRIRTVAAESAESGVTLHFGEPSDVIQVKTLSETENASDESGESASKDTEPASSGSKDTTPASSGSDSSSKETEIKTGTYTVGAFSYNVKGRNATVKAPKKKTAAKLTIPAAVKIRGKSIPVTAIAPNAFKGMKKLTTVTIGKNIKSIGKNAFYGDKKLKKIVISTTKLTQKKVGANAFKGIYNKAVIQCPKAKKTAYKKLLLKKGMKKTVKFK